MGYDPRPDKNRRYYTVGFHTFWPNMAVNNYLDSIGLTECSGVTLFEYFFFPGKRIAPSIPPCNLACFVAIPDTTTQTTFRIEAAGIISSDNSTPAESDQWTIDQDKKIIHYRTGY